MRPILLALVLSAVVFVHEMGHFLVARWCGVTVTTFSIGFGRELWGFDDRHGLHGRVAAVPLGGYVKFLDDENAASQPGPEAAELTPEQQAGSFHNKAVWQRAAVVAAGPFANFLMAAVIYTLINLTVGEEALEQATMSIAREFAQGPTLAHAATKELVHIAVNEGVAAADNAMARVQAPIWSSEDLKIGLASFRKSGPGLAKFQGR